MSTDMYNNKHSSNRGKSRDHGTGRNRSGSMNYSKDKLNSSKDIPGSPLSSRKLGSGAAATQSQVYKTNYNSKDTHYIIYSQLLDTASQKLNSFQYLMNKSTKKSDESLNVMNLPNLNVLHKDQFYIVALKYEDKYVSSIGCAIVPSESTVTVVRNTQSGDIVIDSLVNSSGKPKHSNPNNTIIPSSHKIPVGAVVLRIIGQGSSSSSYDCYESMLVDSYNDSIKVIVSGKDSINNSFMFSQLQSLPKRLPPTYPYIHLDGAETATEIDGNIKTKIDNLPEVVRVAPTFIISEVDKSFKLKVIAAYPFYGNETVVIDCLNSKGQARSLDMFTFDNWRFVRSNPKLNSTFNEEQLIPGMVLIKIAKRNADDNIQILQTLFPGPHVKDVKIRFTRVDPNTGKMSLFNTIPVPDSKLDPNFKLSKRSRSKSPSKAKSPAKKKQEPKPVPEKKPSKPKPVVEYYYYSYSDEEPEVEVKNVTIYVDENGNIIQNGKKKSNQKLDDVLKKMNKDGVKINVKEE